MPDFSADTLLRKLTVKDVMRGVKYKDTGGSVEKETDLFVIYGFAREMRSEDSTFKNPDGSFQQYQRYFGDFRAKRFADQKIVRSTQLILDNFSSDILKLEFLSARKVDPEVDVNFAYIIGVEPFTRGDETKLRHTIKPIRMATDDLPDPLQAIENRMMENMPEAFKHYFYAQSGPAIEDKTSTKSKT